MSVEKDTDGSLSSSELDTLKSVYYDPKSPAGLSSFSKLWKVVKSKEKN